MSASEKLRALEAEAWPKWPGQLTEEAQAKQRHLRNTLPLITGVIQAAEADLAALAVRMAGTDYRFIHETERLAAALTALEEALDGSE